MEFPKPSAIIPDPLPWFSGLGEKETVDVVEAYLAAARALDTWDVPFAEVVRACVPAGERQISLDEIQGFTGRLLRGAADVFEMKRTYATPLPGRFFPRFERPPRHAVPASAFWQRYMRLVQMTEDLSWGLTLAWKRDLLAFSHEGLVTTVTAKEALITRLLQARATAPSA